jgi:hypothetical protein
MRSRILSCALVAGALGALLASQVEAQIARHTVRQPAGMWENWAANPGDSSPANNPTHEQAAYQYSPDSYPSDGSEFIVSDHNCTGNSNYYDNGYCDPGMGDYCDPGMGDYCDPGMGDCGAWYRPYGLSAGAEATYLKPELDDGDAIGPFREYDYEAAPRIWLHWQAPNGAGVRVRYWHLDAEQRFTFADEFDDAAVAATLADDLDVYAIDLELTRAFALFHTECLASLGARHGRLNRHINLQSTNVDLEGGGGDDVTVISQKGDRGMEGTGITTALDMRRPIMQSRWAGVCNVRGSLIWGENELDLSNTILEVVPVGAGDLDINDFDELRFFGRNGRPMWIGEIQAGGEWNTPLSGAFGGGNAFIRLLVEAQWWHLPGVSNRGTGPDAVRQLHEFVGLTAAAGFTR